MARVFNVALLVAALLLLGVVVGVMVMPVEGASLRHTQKPRPSPTASPTPTPSPTPSPSPSASPTSPPPPVDCSGYPQPRIYLQSQAWWFQTPGQSGQSFGHLHVETCFPYGQMVSGTVNFTIVLRLHYNPGTITVISPKIATNAGQVQLTETPLSLSCGNQFLCTWTVPITIDTTRSPYDGLEELRLFTSVSEPDGNVMAASTGWLLDIRNGKPLNNMWDPSTGPREEARGWYTHTCYANALYLSPIPLNPISGSWTFKTNANHGGSGTDCSPQPVTSREVRIDPDFHNNIPGIILFQRSGEGTDTTTFDTSVLAPGAHKLVIITHTDDSTLGSTLSGVEVIPFTVAG